MYVVDMRGIDNKQGVVFSYINLEDRIPQDHPLRAIRRMMNQALEGLSSYFDRLYSPVGRESIPPEQLLRALVLQVLYSIRSERQLMEQLDYNLMFRWFVGLNPDDEIWDVTVYTKNRDRLIVGEVSERLLVTVVEQARAAKLLSQEHFTVDGTLIEAWANRRSFHPKDPEKVVGTGARGRKLLRDKVESTTDPEARLYSKGGPSVSCYIGHVITENRHGLVVQACATQASKTAEPEAALEMLDCLKKALVPENNAEPADETVPEGHDEARSKITLGADTAYQTEAFIVGLRQRNVVPHVAEYEPNPNFPNFLTEEERGDTGFGISQSKRKLVEKVFGWGKQARPVRQTKLRGLTRVDWMFQLTMAAHNLVRMVKLMPPPSPVPVQ
jgi:transposase